MMTPTWSGSMCDGLWLNKVPQLEITEQRLYNSCCAYSSEIFTTNDCKDGGGRIASGTAIESNCRDTKKKYKTSCSSCLRGEFFYLRNIGYIKMEFISPTLLSNQDYLYHPSTHTDPGIQL
jgi:hypothetical protein